MEGKRGFSLVEIVMTMALFSMCIFLLVNIIPTGVMTLRKAEALQSASLYGQELIEDAVRSLPAGGTYPLRDRDFSLKLNADLFHITRDLYCVDPSDPPRLFDIVVVISWSRQSVPLRLARRVFVRDVQGTGS